MKNTKVSAFNPIGTLGRYRQYLSLLGTLMFGAMTGIHCVGNAEMKIEEKTIVKSSVELFNRDANNLYMFYKLAPGDTQTLELDIKNGEKYILEYEHWITKYSPDLSVTHTYQNGTPLNGFKIQNSSWMYQNYGTGKVIESNSDGKMVLTVKNNGAKLLDFWVGFFKITETVIQEDQSYPIKRGPVLYKMNFKKDQNYRITKDIDVMYLNASYRNSTAAPLYDQTKSFNEDTTYYFIYQENDREGFFKIQKSDGSIIEPAPVTPPISSDPLSPNFQWVESAPIQVNLNEIKEGNLLNNNQVDVYKLQSNAQGTLNIKVLDAGTSYPSYTAKTVVSVYDSSGNLVGTHSPLQFTYAGTIYTDDFNFQANPNETYTIKVNAKLGLVKGSYQLLTY